VRAQGRRDTKHAGSGPRLAHGGGRIKKRHLEIRQWTNGGMEHGHRPKWDRGRPNHHHLRHCRCGTAIGLKGRACEKSTTESVLQNCINGGMAHTRSKKGKNIYTRSSDPVSPIITQQPNGRWRFVVPVWWSQNAKHACPGITRNPAGRIYVHGDAPGWAAPG